MKAKKRLSNIDFSSGDAHMALVHEAQGGAANGTKTLTLKSAGGVSDEVLIQIISKSKGVSVEDASEILKSFQSNSEGEQMSDQTLDKSSVEEMIKKAQDEARAEQEQIVKGLQDEISKYQKKDEEVTKAAYVEKAKEFAPLGVDDSNAEAVANALLKMKDDETFKPVQDMLNKALNVAKAESEGAFQEKGHDVKVEETDDDFVAFMKSSYESK